MPDIKALQDELAERRQLLHRVQIALMKPGYTAEEVKLLANLERWLRTEVRMALEALEART
jgi:hypothetical protein